LTSILLLLLFTAGCTRAKIDIVTFSASRRGTKQPPPHSLVRAAAAAGDAASADVTGAGASFCEKFEPKENLASFKEDEEDDPSSFPGRCCCCCSICR
jgi:hypothetical protein